MLKKTKELLAVLSTAILGSAALASGSKATTSLFGGLTNWATDAGGFVWTIVPIIGVCLVVAGGLEVYKAIKSNGQKSWVPGLGIFIVGIVFIGFKSFVGNAASDLGFDSAVEAVDKW